jgi:lipopolysaccharide/colanic/teichoic acid biosynthesis glycosyltransferase
MKTAAQIPKKAFEPQKTPALKVIRSSDDAPMARKSGKVFFREHEVSENIANTLYRKIGKRSFDIVFSILGLILVTLMIPVIAILIKRSSKGPVFYQQTRMTRGMTPFSTWKFRTMTSDADEFASQGITCSGKQGRITKIGETLRRYRIDELPQLWNVLKGEMSLVGPRPQTPRYVDCYPETYQKILAIRPGLTGLASIRFHEKEEAMIAGAGEDADAVYIKKILPMKFKYNLFYVENHSFLLDMKIIWWTILGIIAKCR